MYFTTKFVPPTFSLYFRNGEREECFLLTTSTPTRWTEIIYCIEKLKYLNFSSVVTRPISSALSTQTRQDTRKTLQSVIECTYCIIQSCGWDWVLVLQPMGDCRLFLESSAGKDYVKHYIYDFWWHRLFGFNDRMFGHIDDFSLIVRKSICSLHPLKKRINLNRHVYDQTYDQQEISTTIQTMFIDIR